MTENKIFKPNFFDGRHMSSEEFKANQQYHTDMRYRQNAALHSYGIVRGLKIEADTDTTPPVITITKGMALGYFYNESGELLPKEIVLGNDITFGLDKLPFAIPEDADTLKIKITISFNETKAADIPFKSDEFIHIIEKPVIEIIQEDDEIDERMRIILGVITLNIENKIPSIHEIAPYVYPIYPDEINNTNNLAAWLTAVDGTTIRNNHITQWKSKIGDLSFNSNNDAVGGFRMIPGSLNTHTTLKLEGKHTMEMKLEGNTSLEIREIYIVCRLDADADSEATLMNLIQTSSEIENEYMIRRSETGGYSVGEGLDFSNEGTFEINGIAAALDKPEKWHIIRAVANKEVKINKIMIGARNEGLERPWKGSVAEIIILKKEETDLKDEILAYLKTKYHIAAPYIQPVSLFNTDFHSYRNRHNRYLIIPPSVWHTIVFVKYYSF